MANSLRNIIMELTFFADGEDGTALRVPIDPANHFQSLEVSVLSYGVWTGQITLFDPDTQDAVGVPYLERLIMATGFHHGLEIRWGYDDQDSPFEGNPTYVASIVQVRPNFDTVAGTSYTLVLADGTTPDIMGVPTKAASFAAGVRVSDAVTEIAYANGWKVKNYGAGGKTSIEPTTSTIPTNLAMVNQTHIQFVNDVLQPLAVSDNGDSFFAFFDADGAFHFHSMAWLPVVSASYNYRDIDGEIISFSLSCDSVFSQFALGGNATYVGVDSFNGGFKVAVAGYGAGVRDDAGNRVSLPHVLGAATMFSLPTDRSMRGAVLCQDGNEFESRVRATYAAWEAQCYKANLSVIGTHHPQVQQYLSVERRRSNGSLHPASGYYRVDGVHHAVSGGRWTTNFDLCRSAIIPVVYGTSAHSGTPAAVANVSAGSSTHAAANAKVLPVSGASSSTVTANTKIAKPPGRPKTEINITYENGVPAGVVETYDADGNLTGTRPATAAEVAATVKSSDDLANKFEARKEARIAEASSATDSYAQWRQQLKQAIKVNGGD